MHLENKRQICDLLFYDMSKICKFILRTPPLCYQYNSEMRNYFEQIIYEKYH